MTGKKALTTRFLFLCSNIELASHKYYFFYKREAFVCKTYQAKSLFTPWFVSLFIELENPDLMCFFLFFVFFYQILRFALESVIF